MTVSGGTVQASTRALDITTSNVTVSGMTLQGPGYGSYKNDYAIGIRGSSATAYLSNVTLSGNTISGWDGDGIFASFVHGFTFSNNAISNIWYAGIDGASLQNGQITGNQIQNVVGTPNAYGIILSRSYGGLAQYPRSSDVLVSGNTIQDIPNWEGLDTHGGQRIQFVNNVIRDVRNPIMVGDCPDASGGLPMFAPLDVTVSGNTIESGVTDGSQDVGIYFFGANAGSGVLGSSTELATGGVISGNTITGYGSQSNGDSAAIFVHDTSGLQITSNTIIEASPTAISIYYNNYNFTVSGNTIRDPWSNALSYAYGIYVHVDYNTGTISANTFQRGTKSATSVLTAKVVVINYPHNSVTVQ